MTSIFRHEVRLAAPVDRVLALLTDPSSHVARYAAAGATDAQVTSRVVDAAGAITLVSRRSEGGSVPRPIARVVRGAAQITQTERWSAPGADGGRTAVWSVLTSGVPVDIAGTTEIRPAGTGATLIETGTITARVPLLSALIERVAAEQSGAKLDLEWRWLAEHL